MHWIVKLLTPFNGLNVLYHRAKFGGDRSTRAGCRCINVVFVCFFFLCHAPSPADRSLEWDILRTAIVSLFIGRF